jgi:hypothetical protein
LILAKRYSVPVRPWDRWIQAKPTRLVVGVTRILGCVAKVGETRSPRRRGERRSRLVAQQRVHLARGEAHAPAQEGELDEEAAAGDLAS